MAKRPGIYLVRNELTRAVYVGSAQHIPRRLYVHRWMLRRGKHFSIHLQRAFDLYGDAALSFEEHEYVADPEQRIAREQYWIDYFQAADGVHGYNTCPVAGTREGVPQPASVAEKLRAVHLGKPKTAEHRAKIAAARKGQRKSPEHKRKLSEAAIRQFANPEARAKNAQYAKLARGFKGKRHSSLSIEKMRQSHARNRKDTSR